MFKKYCTNCNRHGHIFRMCRHAINSYGLIIFQHFQDRQTRYLMIQRRFSVYYSELLRGNYVSFNINLNYDYLTTLIRHLPLTERNYIIQHDFSYLWDKMWQWKGNLDETRHIDHLKKPAEIIFNKYKTGFEHPAHGTISFSRLFEKYPASTIEPVWEIPKGRRKLYETDLNCAIRETNEETTVTPDKYHIYEHVIPFRQIHTGINGVRYCISYYLAQMYGQCHIYYHPDNRIQNNEIRKIGWFTLTEIRAMSCADTHYLEILERVEKLTRSLSLPAPATI